ncbi:sialate O-acetylesterase [Flammeovirgaceae bacterium 311]|nr:sialate O-acetylesterase [Flammeovirgaceae bacterium 311]
MKLSRSFQYGMNYMKVFFLILLNVSLLQAAAGQSTGYGIPDSLRQPKQEAHSFTLANVLQSHMVIQQAKPLKLWGTAPAGAPIHLQADWQKEPATARADANGKWMSQLPVPAATPGNFEAHSISVIHGEDTLTLTDILIGEVWLCSGQSNMDMEMKANPPWLEGVIDFEKEIAAADHPSIRFINIEKKFTKAPQDEAKGSWQVVSPQTAGQLSGVAYYFGRELLQNLELPVGLVVSSFGGSAAQAWTSRDALAADPLVKKHYLDPYDNSPQAKESLDSIKTLEKLFEVLARPALLYNAMIHPLRNLSVKGFLWYQGEANKKDGSMYTNLQAALIRGWRKDFGQGLLPFYYVQMTPYNWEENDSTATYYARLREAQEAVMQQVENTGMAVTMDIGEPDNIHPRNKRDVGIRLSRLALHHTYGHQDLAYQGPRFTKFTVKESTVRLEFNPESIGSGLSTTDQQAPRHFYLAGKEGVFYPAEARIVNDQVWLHSAKVKKPVAVRYAFTNYPITNFGNKEGLPAMPFRTDQWKE